MGFVDGEDDAFSRCFLFQSLVYGLAQGERVLLGCGERHGPEVRTDDAGGGKRRADACVLELEPLRGEGGDYAVAQAEGRGFGNDRPATSGCKAGEFAQHNRFPVAALARDEHEAPGCPGAVFEAFREVVDD